MKALKIGLMTTVALFIAMSSRAVLPDMKATLQVSGGGIYDYVVVGMMDKATDGFDNAYDAFAPVGNMNDTYIKTTIAHPEWYTVKSEFRSDIRSIKELQEWTIAVYTNLPAGTPLTIALKDDASTVPADYTLTVQDIDTGVVADLKTGSYSFTVSASGVTKDFKVVAAETASPQTPPSGADPGVPPPAQSSFVVSGKVKDLGGAPMDGVKITLSGNGSTYTATSDSAGAYHMQGVAPGSYTLVAAKKASRKWKYQFDPVSVLVKDTDVTADIICHKKKKKRWRIF